MRQLARQKAELDEQREENRRLIEQRIGSTRYQQRLEEKNAALNEQNSTLTEKLLERDPVALLEGLPAVRYHARRGRRGGLPPRLPCAELLSSSRIDQKPEP